jgi:hypothetical protein
VAFRGDIFPQAFFEKLNPVEIKKTLGFPDRRIEGIAERLIEVLPDRMTGFLDFSEHDS